MTKTEHWLPWTSSSWCWRCWWILSPESSSSSPSWLFTTGDISLPWELWHPSTRWSVSCSSSILSSMREKMSVLRNTGLVSFDIWFIRIVTFVVLFQMFLSTPTVAHSGLIFSNYQVKMCINSTLSASIKLICRTWWILKEKKDFISLNLSSSSVTTPSYSFSRSGESK